MRGAIVYLAITIAKANYSALNLDMSRKMDIFEKLVKAATEQDLDAKHDEDEDDYADDKLEEYEDGSDEGEENTIA